MPFVWDKTLLEEFIRIHIQIRSIIYDIKWCAFRENICKSLIIQKEYIVQCWSTECPFPSFSILFPMQKPVQFDWISWSFRFQVAGFIPSLPDLPVFNQRRWSTKRGEGQQEDVMMDLLDFVRNDVSEAWFVEAPILENHVTWWLHHGEWKKTHRRYLLSPIYVEMAEQKSRRDGRL